MYRLLNYTSYGFQRVERMSDGAIIPISDDNRDYAEYLAWVAEGNTPEEVTL